MDVSHPITAITTPLAGRVLEVLAGTTRPLSGRGVHKLADASTHVSVTKVLEQLAEHGLVLADRQASATFFSANRDHLAWPAVEQLATLRKQLRTRLANDIGSWQIAPAHASIYGSAARGDGDTESDIDLLFIVANNLSHADSEGFDRQVDRLRDAGERWTGNAVSAKVLTYARLLEHARAEDPIVTAWRRDGIVLHGPELHRLIADLR